MEHLKALKKYIKNGICTIPANVKDKYPSMLRGWKQFETQLPTTSDIQGWNVYYDSNRFGICIICGQVSGGLFVFDFDNKLNNAEQIFNEFTDINEVGSIIRKYDLPIETTQSGGYHIYVRLKEAPGNTVFARDYNEQGKPEAIIESRGEGGLIVCSPTKGYNIVSGDLTNIPTITDDDFAVLTSYARSFNKVPETATEQPRTPQKQPINPSYGDRPGDIYNQRVNPADLLKEQGWKQLYKPQYWRRPGKEDGVSGTLGIIGENVFYCFTPNAYPLEERRSYRAFDLYTAFHHNGDYTEAAKQVIKDFGLKPSRPKQQKNKSHKKKSTPHNTTDQEPIKVPKGINIVTKQNTENNRIFWYVTDKGAVMIDYKELNKFMLEEGFFKYQINEDSLMLVKITGNVVEEYTQDMIYNYVRKHIDRLDEDGDIYNKIRKNKSMLNAEDLSRELETIEIDFVKDTREFTYVFYKNTVVKVSANGISLVRYEDLDGKVWKKQIIDRDFKILDENIVDECDAKLLAEKFCADNEQRMRAYMSALGYLINRYKTQENCPVIDFADEDMVEGESRGGTGKGLTLKMVKQIRNVVTIDGKSFDTTKTFAFSRVNPDTDVILIDDIDKRYDFQKLFSLVTEGLPIEKKYQNEIYIDFKDAPKWAITRNHPLAGSGGSFDRRLFSIEIHPFLSANYTPSDFLGKELFNWDEEEWLKFDNFMMHCAKLYLKFGLIKPEYVNLEVNKLKANTRVDFVEWADEHLKEGARYNKKDLRIQYATDNNVNKVTQHSFNKWLKLYFEFKGWRYDFEVGAGKAYVQIHYKNDSIEALRFNETDTTKNTKEEFHQATTKEDQPPTQTLEEPPF